VVGGVVGTLAEGGGFFVEEHRVVGFGDEEDAD
jgi:hypothetical protein